MGRLYRKQQLDVSARAMRLFRWRAPDDAATTAAPAATSPATGAPAGGGAAAPQVGAVAGQVPAATQDDAPDSGQVPQGEAALRTELEKARKALHEANAEAAEFRRAKKAAEKAAKDAEANALEKNQEWEKLARQREARITELEAQIEALTPRAEDFEKRATRYAEALKAHLATVKAGLPAHIIKLLEKQDPVDQLHWLAENAEALKPAAGPAQPGQTAGVPATPKPADGKGLTDQQKREAQAAAERSARSMF